MNRLLVLLAGLAGGCSAEAVEAPDYATALECELTVGTLAAFDNMLSHDKVVEYAAYHDMAVRRTATLGEQLGKSPQRIELDRRDVLQTIVDRSPGEALEFARNSASHCLSEGS